MSSVPLNPRPALRLVHADSDRSDTQIRIRSQIERETRRAAINPDLDPADPRWILATKTRQALDGSAINPVKRRNLLRLATSLGMRPFDANLVIAIVQDEARRITTNIRYSQSLNHESQLADRLRIIPRKTSQFPDTKTNSSNGNRFATQIILALTFSATLFAAALIWLFSTPK